MTTENSFIDIGKLSKPINTLVNKLATATGALYEPTRMRRKAKAEIEIDDMKLAAVLGVTSEEVKAFRRAIYEKRREQILIDNIIDKSKAMIIPEARPQDVGDDWLVNFVDKIKFASSEEMQVVWAKILASEANEPDKFSKKAVNLVSTLDKNDISDFMKLARFTISYGKEMTPTVFNYRDKVYSQNGVTFDLINNLESIGLVTFTGTLSYSLEYEQGAELEYFNQRYKVASPSTGSIDIGSILFTKVGSELLNIAKVNSIKNYSSYLVSQLKLRGVDIVLLDKKE